ncbi:hypothetical protein GT360_07275 [Vibrio astriarenae]|uniref:Uncharacterized protein n=1 Tax=Vibrio astriarenae TaxID=1481923 RepID=A0A7Z2YDF0_9VIBR|nr:hypothetical protein [Vibrio astriarenae]QIA63331.1 hypothetical protein GT360_07275 [Vibrio astriarenae]
MPLYNELVQESSQLYDEVTKAVNSKYSWLSCQSHEYTKRLNRLNAFLDSLESTNITQRERDAIKHKAVIIDSSLQTMKYQRFVFFSLCLVGAAFVLAAVAFFRL